MAMGPPVGSPFSGPGATQISAAAGLPFAGVPTELAERADAVLATEPDHLAASIDFDAAKVPEGRFTLRSLFRRRRLGVAVALVLLVAETLTMLLGPALTQIGIDDGVRAGNKTTLVTVVIVYLGVILGHVGLNRARIRWTADLGESLMYDVRVRVFSHFQRMSLDWFTTEKTGVLLSRMTSDIEALSQLLTEGFTNLFIQALTLVFVTAILLTYDVRLALILLLVVMPPLIALQGGVRTGLPARSGPHR